MNLVVESYEKQRKGWPKVGRHILAQYNEDAIIVYQAYRPSIGRYAIEHQELGGDFSLRRMSWIKPNFLWMMYRSGWGTKEGQEVTLAIWITRTGFEEILQRAVHSSFQSEIYANREEWEVAVKHSDVRLQWDPDHSPRGEKLNRKAIQLGLRGMTLRRYASEWIISIQDISAFVAEQLAHLRSNGILLTPKEKVYTVSDHIIARRLRLSDCSPD